MQKTPKSPLLIGPTIAVLGTLVLILADTALKDWLIIGFGVRIFSLVKTIGTGIAIFGIILTVLLLIPVIKAKLSHSRQQRQEEQVTADYVKEIDNPKTIRQRLERLQQEYPSLATLIDKFIIQMNRMDVIQDRQHRLITENDASYLNNTEEVLNSVERRLCRNVRMFINLCLATHATSPRLDNDKVHRIYQDNEKILDQSSNLTVVSADYINKRNTSPYDYRGDIQVVTETIQDLLKEDIS